MTDPTDAAALALEPGGLDGHTLDELNDYLDDDRRPADPSIDNSPACQIALGALERLRAVTGAYLDEDDPPSASDQSWIAGALSAISLEARAGRSFPYPRTETDTVAHVTEGALRGLIRSIGDDAGGLIVGKVRFGPTEDEQPVDLRIEVAAVYGSPIAGTVEAFTRTLDLVLRRQAPMPVGRIDVHVVDVVALGPRPTRSRGGV